MNAVDDLERICESIQVHSREAACEVASQIYNEAARLGDFPNLGRVSQRLDGKRELTVALPRSIVVYQVTPDAAEILHISQGRDTGIQS